MKFDIISRWSGLVLFSLETTSLKLAVEAGLKSGANLTDADLRDDDLRGVNLRDANLRGADFRGANLTGADLTDAYLTDADLTGADLRGADLRDADFRDADLRDANLRDANLRGADFRGANLTGADLRDADFRDANLKGAVLTPIRDDLWAVLSSSPAEVVGLRQAIIDGKIDGSTYEGSCACLVGTLANVRQCKYNDIPGLSANSARPIERFFCAIKPGDTPETSQASRLALEWVDQWLANVRGAFAGTIPK